MFLADPSKMFVLRLENAVISTKEFIAESGNFPRNPTDAGIAPEALTDLSLTFPAVGAEALVMLRIYSIWRVPVYLQRRINWKSWRRM